MNYSGFGRRLVAVLLDAVILGVISGIIAAILGGILGGKAMNNGEASSSFIVGFVTFNNVVSIVLTIGYYVFYQAKMGQTLGKKVMGIKVVDAKGKTPGALTFFLREIVGKMVSGIILGIGYLMVLWDGKKQALHDKIASTYVVKA